MRPILRAEGTKAKPIFYNGRDFFLSDPDRVQCRKQTA